MSRYTGPSCKICRRNKEKLFLKGERCETAKCSLDKRNFPPGSNTASTKKTSEYGKRMREKQKLRFFYGVTERQMRHFYKKAHLQKGVTGHNLLSLFERRMDNIVFRAHLARSRQEARQLVLHGHFIVNGKKVTIPSFVAKNGDEIKITEKSLEFFKPRLEKVVEKAIPSWLAFEGKTSSIKLSHLPSREEIDVPVEEQLIVEFYSR